MPYKNRFNTILWLAVIGLTLCFAAPLTHAGDLPAAGDGEHLWLVQQAAAPENDKDADATLAIYHLPADTETYRATKLDPITGQLMPRGIAAGDGRLLIVTSDRQLITIRPVWSELLRDWVYQQRTLTALPEGCTLLAVTMGDRGPWALVKVQSRELLDQLNPSQAKTQGLTDQQLFNKAMGLPEDFELDWPDRTKEDAPKEETPQEDGEEGQEKTPVGADDADSGADAEGDAGVSAEPQSEPESNALAEPTLPAYRLISLRSSKWVSTPLPADLAVPREAALFIRPGDDRPTLLVDNDSSSRFLPVLVRYSPVTPPAPSDGQVSDESGTAEENASQVEAASWGKRVTGMQLRTGRQWSAALIDDKLVIALERDRPQELVTIDTFRLRSGVAYEVGSTNLSTGENARWAMFPRKSDIALIVSPAPTPDPSVVQEGRPPTLALLAGLDLDGQAMFESDEGKAQMMLISENKPGALEGRADLIIQIIALVAAMFMMVMFYRRDPQNSQVDLPDHLVLASFSRRAIAGVIDLTPGFILATLIYDMTVGQIMFESWPGNGIEKAFVAMRPGFVVIGVTLFHTTISEFILARSLGKILMGMYVADLNGKPAPPMPSLGRALSRAFELFAPLMILVAVISPARQRLGDILAKTTVVMRKPEPIKFEDDDQ